MNASDICSFNLTVPRRRTNNVHDFLPFQVFLKELQQWQGQVDETNALADKLLTLYANDDTHKVTQVNNNMTATWTHISKR